MAHKIVAVLGDLMFTVKISDAAKRAGVPIEFVKTADDALQRATGAAVMILDLNFAPADLIVRMKSSESTRAIPLVGYVSHVQTDVIRQAKDSGCDTVLARSAFVQKLGDIMQRFAVGGQEPGC
jgi:CheY-like chemotaxis protein